MKENFMKLIAPVNYVEPAALSNEKSMWQLYKLSFSFPISRFNVAVVVLCFALLVAFGVFSVSRIDVLASMIKSVLAFGTAIAPSILGFLVAGFTIFVTITRVELFEYMAVRRYKNTPHSYLKYNMSAFILAFCHYIAYMIFCAIMIVFAQPLGPAVMLVKILFPVEAMIFGVSSYGLFLVFVFAVFGSWTIYLLMLLKSFVYNTYQVLTTTVRWGFEGDNKNKYKGE